MTSFFIISEEIFTADGADGIAEQVCITMKAFFLTFVHWKSNSTRALLVCILMHTHWCKFKLSVGAEKQQVAAVRAPVLMDY